MSAHTSAGKTAVAEYAIALAFKADQRVVYTSPLKVCIPSGSALRDCCTFCDASLTLRVVLLPTICSFLDVDGCCGR